MSLTIIDFTTIIRLKQIYVCLLSCVREIINIPVSMRMWSLFVDGQCACEAEVLAIIRGAGVEDKILLGRVGSGSAQLVPFSGVAGGSVRRSLLSLSSGSSPWSSQPDAGSGSYFAQAVIRDERPPMTDKPYD